MWKDWRQNVWLSCYSLNVAEHDQMFFLSKVLLNNVDVFQMLFWKLGGSNWIRNVNDS